VTKLTPRIGTEIKGVQLSELTDIQKDELALLIAERGVGDFFEARISRTLVLRNRKSSARTSADSTSM
jgi:alpha-ketoglutarate-dependent taurine dioxygenase